MINKKQTKKEYDKEYLQRPEVKGKRLRYRQKPEVKEYMRKWKRKNEDYLKEYIKKWRKEHKHHMKDYMKMYSSKPENKEKKKIRDQKPEYKRKMAIYSQTPKRIEYLKEYSQKPEVKERINHKSRERRKNDSNFGIKCRIRRRFNHAMEDYTKTGKIMLSKEYGIDMEEIIKHLSPFPKNLENYHVDHIIPLKMFNLNNPEQVRRAWAPENLQWLTVQENLEKGDRLVMPHYQDYRGVAA